MPAIVNLAITAALTAPPASGATAPPPSAPATFRLTGITVAASVTMALPARPATIPWAEFHRRESACARPGAARAFVARLGAGLAWDLANLPRHQLGATRPWYGSSTDFAATVVPPGVDRGAINACIAHWNTVYPPYALSVDDVRQENDPSEEPSCPGN